MDPFLVSHCEDAREHQNCTLSGTVLVFQGWGRDMSWKGGKVLNAKNALFWARFWCSARKGSQNTKDMPTRVCPSCSGGGMAVVVVEVSKIQKKETNGRTLYAVPCAHFLASPTLPGGFPSLSVHLQPHVVVLSCRLSCRVLELMWHHCRHVAAIPAVLFCVLAM